LSTRWREARFAVVDVEGNGAQPPDIVEIACLHLDGGEIRPALHTLVRPPRPISPLVSRKHGIANDDVASAPSFPEIRARVAECLQDRVLVAHNARVEVDVLSRALGGLWRPTAVLDTLALARRVVPGRESYALPPLAAALELERAGPAHRAAADAELTARLLIKLAERSRIETLDDLLALAGPLRSRSRAGLASARTSSH
jgi:exodeoxyribonuclease X